MTASTNDAAPATRGLMFRTIKGVADIFTEAIGGHTKRIAELEKRIAALEAKPSLKYMGAYRDRPYTAGAAVTRQGSLWIAKVDTDGVPGDSADWQLAVKQGKA